MVLKPLAATCTLTIILLDGQVLQLSVSAGANLRHALMNHGISPYTTYTRQLNCGGRGLCATCGVWIREGAPPPAHWHDKAAERFGYPRLSCQITVNRDMRVELVDKWIWGGRK